LSDIKSTKGNGVVFLAAVLVAGIFAAMSPSFITGVNAQYEIDTRYSNYEPEPEHRDKGYYSYEPEYSKYLDKKYHSYESDYGMDKRYNSYESQYPPEYKDNNNYNSNGPEYPLKHTDDKKYNSYKPDHYGMDNDYDKKSYGYEPTTSYGMDDKKYNSYEPTTTSYGNDNNYQKIYGNDNSYEKSQYQSSSYKPDYKPAYPSYGKDDRDKSKDSSKSVSINKLKCINNNVNINGNNAGHVSIGNKGQAAYAEEGYSGAYPSDSEYSGEGYYYDGHNNKQDKGFTCIINNNNNNTNIIAGGNQTEPEPEPEPTPCENCFSSLSPTEINEFLTELSILTTPSPAPIQSLAQLCAILDSLVTLQSKEQAFTAIQDALAATTGVSMAERSDILICLQQLELIIAPG
jgi:hypothetical protein